MGRGGRGRARTCSADGMRSVAANPASSHDSAAQDDPSRQMDPEGRPCAKSRAGGRVSIWSAGMVLAEEESEFSTCGFCGASPFYGAASKLGHLRDAHGMTPNTPGCEPHGRVFPSWDEYEEHRATEHAD